MLWVQIVAINFFVKARQLDVIDFFCKGHTFNTLDASTGSLHFLDFKETCKLDRQNFAMEASITSDSWFNFTSDKLIRNP